jgi:transposase
MLAWGHDLDQERVWAIEDCRHVSGKLEEGVATLPEARLDGPAREIKLLLDHRDDLVGERTRIACRLRWALHDRWPELVLPSGCPDRMARLDPLAGRLARCQQDADVRVMRSQVRRLRELTREARALEHELAVLVEAQQPQLLELPGIGTLTAAKLIAEIAGIERFESAAKLARLAGIAPIPASSGNSLRVRLHRGGNRQINAAVHRIAVTQGMHPPAIEYIARKTAEGKSKREATRCLKRHLIRVIYRTMMPSPTSIPEPLLT